MKLSSPFLGNTIVITQSPHGAYQNGQAIDCVPVSGDRVIAPCDMDIYYRKNDLGYQSYSYARDANWKIVFVHCIIEKSGRVKRGEDIGYLHKGGAIHLHYSIEVAGTWENPLNYTDRSVKLTLSGNFTSQKWKDWNTYPNKQLLPITNNPPMAITDANLKKMKTLVDKFNTSVFKTLKTNAELTAWWLKNGIYETLNYVNNLIEQSSKRAAEIKQLKAEKVLMQKEIDELKKENTSLKASNAKLTKQNDELDLSNKDMTVMVMNLEELNHTLQDENDDLSAKLETASTLAIKWEEKYKKCAEGQQGTTIDLDAIVTHAIRWFRGLFNRLFDKLSSWRK